MREALLVAMHDSKNMIHVEGRNNQILASRVAPGYRAILTGIEKIMCRWWDDRLLLTIIVPDCQPISITYRGAYTAVCVPSPHDVPEPEESEREELLFSGTAFSGAVIKHWVEKQENATI